jgi:eukaryotic-like serine/threonine-protein kinase
MTGNEMNEAETFHSRSEKEIFFEALDKNTPQERAAFLDGACGKDSARRARVEVLLADHFHEDAFMNKPAAAREEPIKTIKLCAVVNPNDEAVGQTVGRYKLLEKVGEGGCGAVYVAQQNEPVRRRVALKVIKLGMDTKEVIARFEAERQALAMMDHPNIAKVFDAGTTDTGRPYFVMELVRGIKITDYCDQANLTTKERLTLLIEVCHAVQHAHQKGIIHRDIKPSNIMVTLHDGVPVPKVIDFGIAKATEGRLTDETVYTQLHQFIGTPAYMSPEQAEMSGLDIDTRSDIYSLGVLLYELLAGSTPFDAKELMSCGLDAMRKIIREQEPVRPSTRFATLHEEELTTTAKRRSTDTAKLLHQLRGDLDWIVMKCLEKDRSRRYETANGLAMDIQRHLQNELVVARPPSLGYKFQKLVRRNKLAFAAVGAVIAALIVGLGVATWAFFKEQQARQQAEVERKAAKMEAAKATAISDFFQQSLRAANPDELKGSDYTVRKLLDDFSSGLENQFQDQPEVEAAVRETIGKAYYRLGSPDKAQVHLQRALMLRRRLYGENEQVAATLADCAWASFEQGQFTNAESQARGALGIYRQDGMVGQPVLFALWALQETLNSEGKFADVETVTGQALDIARKTPDQEFPETASIIHGLAQAKLSQSKYPEAEALARQALEMHRRLQGSQHPETGWALLSLARAFQGQQKLDEAERADREALTIFRKQYSSGHKSVDAATSDLQAVLEAKRDWAGLVALDQNTLTDQRLALGNDSPAVATTLSTLAGHLQSQGKPAEAEQELHEALDITLKSVEQNPSKLPALLRQESQSLNALGESPEAEKLYDDTINAGRLKLGETNLIVGELFHDYGIFLSHEGKWEPAAECLLKSLPIRRTQEDDNLYLTLRGIGDALNQLGRGKEAEAYLRESLALYHKLHQDDTEATGWTTDKLGYALWQQHKLPEAEQAYRDALSIYTKLGAVGDSEYPYIVGLLRNVLMAENKPAEVETLYHDVIAAQRSALGHDSSVVVATLFDLANLLKSENRTAEAAQTYREVVDVAFKPHGKDPLQVPPIVEQQAQSLVAMGRFPDAEQIYEAAIEIARQDFGITHPALGVLYYDLGSLLRSENKLEAATEQCHNALQIQSGAKDEALAATLRALGWLQLHTGKPEEAEQSLREVLDIYRALPQQQDFRRTAFPGMNLGIALFDQQKFPEAEQSLREAVSLISPYRATNEDTYIYSVCCLAIVLKTENKLTESETFLNDVLSKDGQGTVAADLIENASTYQKAIWPDAAANLVRQATEILQQAPAEELVKLPSTVFPLLVETGNKQLVTNICRLMLNSTSTNGDWFNGASWYLATAANPTNRDPALAVELAKRAVAINPHGDWNTVAVAYYRAGDFKQTLADLPKFNVGNSYNSFFLAMAKHQLGDADAARQYYDQAIQWMNAYDPQNPELLRFRAEAEQLLGPEARAGAETQIPVPRAAK